MVWQIFSNIYLYPSTRSTRRRSWQSICSPRPPCSRHEVLRWGQVIIYWWARKLYKVNSHIFQAKRFNRRAYCSDRIWGKGSTVTTAARTWCRSRASTSPTTTWSRAAMGPAWRRGPHPLLAPAYRWPTWTSSRWSLSLVYTSLSSFSSLSLTSSRWSVGPF